MPEDFLQLLQLQLSLKICLYYEKNNSPNATKLKHSTGMDRD